MLAAIGVSHRTARQDARERAAFTDRAARLFADEAARTGAAGCLVLSTCNRSEVFATVPDEAAARRVRDLYAQRSGVPPLHRLGAEAVRYLFRIAAGLESQVVGENEILGQVRDAYDRARATGRADRELNLLVQGAVTCAKRIKTELRLGAVPPSVASVGVDFLARRFGVAGRRALVIGRGQVARAAAARLREAGAAVAVCNRTGGAGVIDFARRYEAMAGCAFVVSATSSPHLVVRREEVTAHGLVFLDLASPRDIDPALPSVYDLDALGRDGQGPGGAMSGLAEAERMIEAAAAAAQAKVDEARRTTHGARRLVIGTRGSRLALAQAESVRARLEAAWPGTTLEIAVISTHGDRDRSRPIAAIGDNALFTRDIETALLDGRIDLAVHSMKDLPAVLPDGLALADAWGREDPRDVLVLKAAPSLAALPPGAVVATGSVRRTALLKRLRPDLRFTDIRGNVETRLRRLFAPKHDEPRLDGLCLAAAGLKRLGRADAITEYLDPAVVIPAPCQGTLALEVRARDTALLARLNRLADRDAARIAATERAFLRAAGGDCREVIGALARIGDDGGIVLACVHQGRFATLRGATPEEVVAQWAK